MADTKEVHAIVIDGSGAVKGGQDVGKASVEIEKAARKVQDATRGQEKYLDSLTRRYDPATAAAAKYAKEVARLEGIISGGGPNSERASQMLALVHEHYKKLGDGADNASGKTSRFGAAMQQAGYQVADIANQVGAGGNAFVAVGMQLGQFLGAFGTVGAVAGAVISIMGPLAAKLLDTADSTKKEAEAQERLNKAFDAAQPAIDRYLAVRDRLDRRPEGWREDKRRLDDVNEEIRLLEKKREDLVRRKDFFQAPSLSLRPDADDFSEIDLNLLKLRAESYQLRVTPGQTEALKRQEDEEKTAADLAKTLGDLYDKRSDEAALIRASGPGKDRDLAMLRAELEVRSRLAGTRAPEDVVNSEISSARSNAGAMYDMEQRKREYEETERKAKESEKKFKEARDQYELETRAEEAKDLEKRAKGVETINDYVYGLERETALLAVSATERERVNATLQAENIAKQAGIELGDEERARIDAAYEARERVTEAMKRQSQAEQQLEKFGERAFDRIGSAMTQMAMQGNSAFQSLRNIGLAVISELMQEFVKLAAINPLKNAIFGGSSPTFSGLLSGLFGDSSYGGTGAYGGVSDNITAGSGSFSSPITVGIPMAFADGTNSAGSGFALVGEEGPELIQMSGGERVYTADQTSRLLGGASNSNGQTVSITNYVEAGASMADVEAAVASGLQQAAPHFVNAAVQRSVPMAMAAMRNSVNRGGSDAQTFGRR